MKSQFVFLALVAVAAFGAAGCSEDVKKGEPKISETKYDGAAPVGRPAPGGGAAPGGGGGNTAGSVGKN